MTWTSFHFFIVDTLIFFFNEEEEALLITYIFTCISIYEVGQNQTAAYYDV